MDSFFGVRARNVKEFYRIVGFLKPIVYKEKVGYDLLQDILNLCRVYYKRRKAMNERITAANLLCTYASLE